MKNKIKIIALVCVAIILVFGLTYYNYFVRGAYTSPSGLLVYKAEVNGNIVTVTGDTASSGTGYAGYDTVWVADELWIKPKYSIVSKFNPRGRFEISYDKKDRVLHKIFLAGSTDEDKKQIWPENELEAQEFEPRQITVFEYSDQEAVNPGYRVIVTDSFSFEVPDGWSAIAEKDADESMINLSDETGAAAGSIERLPVGTELTQLTPSGLFWQQTHENAENGQKTLVTVFRTDQTDNFRTSVIADRIADSIKEIAVTDLNE